MENDLKIPPFIQFTEFRNNILHIQFQSSAKIRALCYYKSPYLIMPAIPVPFFIRERLHISCTDSNPKIYANAIFLACVQTLVTGEERKERNYKVCATA